MSLVVERHTEKCVLYMQNCRVLSFNLQIKRDLYWTCTCVTHNRMPLLLCFFFPSSQLKSNCLTACCKIHTRCLSFIILMYIIRYCCTDLGIGSLAKHTHLFQHQKRKTKMFCFILLLYGLYMEMCLWVFRLVFSNLSHEKYISIQSKPIDVSSIQFGFRFIASVELNAVFSLIAY